MDWDNVDNDARLQVPDDVLAVYPSDRDSLFSLIRPQVTVEMLSIIAAGDYGLDHEAHLAELKRLKAGIDLDKPLEWEPKEVLELFRWSEFTEQRPFRKPEEFHLARAFCCATLLLTPSRSEGDIDFETNTLAPLIESCSVLGKTYLSALGGYLTWSLSKVGLWNDDLMFFAFGLAVVVGNASKGDSGLLTSIGTWLVEADRELVPQYREIGITTPRTFLDSGCIPLYPEKWQELAKEAIPRYGDHPEVVQLLASVAS